jgi:hypothetical protein
VTTLKKIYAVLIEIVILTILAGMTVGLLMVDIYLLPKGGVVEHIWKIIPICSMVIAHFIIIAVLIHQAYLVLPHYKVFMIVLLVIGYLLNICSSVFLILEDFTKYAGYVCVAFRYLRLAVNVASFLITIFPVFTLFLLLRRRERDRIFSIIAVEDVYSRFHNE